MYVRFCMVLNTSILRNVFQTFSHAVPCCCLQDGFNRQQVRRVAVDAHIQQSLQTQQSQDYEHSKASTPNVYSPLSIVCLQEDRINRQQVRRVAGDTYACIKCSMLLILEPGDPRAPSANCVTCSSCGTVQCCKCGVIWGPQHERLLCIDFQKRQAGAEDAAEGADSETKRVLEHTVACPGGCGHTVTKARGEKSCNVMSCRTCRLYFCYLCGAQIKSDKFDLTDRWAVCQGFCDILRCFSPIA
jgi:hypothetical protein